MSHETIIRAWKDETFRTSLGEAERALLPANPAGLIELDDAQLEVAAGAMMRNKYTPNATCTEDTYVCCCDTVLGCWTIDYCD